MRSERNVRIFLGLVRGGPVVSRSHSRGRINLDSVCSREAVQLAERRHLPSGAPETQILFCFPIRNRIDSWYHAVLTL